MAHLPSYRSSTQLQPISAATSATLLVGGHLLRGGARVAWRVAAPVTATVCAVAGFMGPDLVQSLGQVLFPAAVGVGIGPGIVTFLLLALARNLQSRLRAGDAHLRSLPIAATQIRRGRLLAVVIGQAPLALALAAVFLGTVDDELTTRSNPATLLGLCLAPFGAAVATAPVARPRSLSLAAAALGLAGTLGALSGSSSLGLLSLGSISIALWLPVRLEPLRSPRTPSRAASRSGGAKVPLPWLRSWRAVGACRWAAAFVAPAFCVVAAAAFTTNNELTVRTASSAWRLGASFAMVLLLGTIAGSLQRHRAPWAWSRSLPRSSPQQVGSDAALLTMTACVLLLALAPTAPGTAILAASLLPYLSVRAATVARTRAERWAGSAVLGFTIEGGILAGATALLWWVPLASLAMLPVAWSWAVAAERSARRTRAVEIYASDAVASTS